MRSLGDLQVPDHDDLRQTGSITTPALEPQEK